MEQVLSFLVGLTFAQAATIALGVFAAPSGEQYRENRRFERKGAATERADFPRLRGKERSEVGRDAAARVGGEETRYLHGLASLIVLVPTAPELLSVFENIKIIKTGVDTKPKGESE
jgi:hypothetical protein